KDKILQRMPHNLKTLEDLLRRNREDFPKTVDPSISEEDRKEYRRRLKQNRRKTVHLGEELSIRTQKIQRLMRKMHKISARMEDLERQIADLAGLRSAREDKANLEAELRDLMYMTFEDAAALRRRVEIIRERFQEYEKAKRDLSGGNLRLVVS